MVVRYEKYINEGKYFEAQKSINEDVKTSSISTNINLDSTEKVNNERQSYLINKPLILLSTVVTFGLIYFYIVIFEKKATLNEIK